jgi:hypothetical protein
MRKPFPHPGLQHPTVLGAVRNHSTDTMALQAKGVIFAFMLLALILIPISTVHAQEEQTPTPTPTATPAPMYQITLPSGSLMQVDRSVSYGDIAIFCAIIFFTTIYAVVNILRLTHVSSDN